MLDTSMGVFSGVDRNMYAFANFQRNREKILPNELKFSLGQAEQTMISERLIFLIFSRQMK